MADNGGMDPVSPPPLWRPLAGRSFALSLGFFCACNALGALCIALALVDFLDAETANLVAKKIHARFDD